MRRYLNRLYLIGIIGIVFIIFSCSKEEVNPLQKYFGVYDIYTKGIPAVEANDNYPNSGFRLVIREANENKVTVSFYAETVSPNSDKISTFSNCEIIAIDTTGNKYQEFARIITKEQEEIGRVSLLYRGPKIGVTDSRLFIRLNFMIEPNNYLRYPAIQRKEG
jgi:hypothetical protein